MDPAPRVRLPPCCLHARAYGAPGRGRSLVGNAPALPPAGGLPRPVAVGAAPRALEAGPAGRGRVRRNAPARELRLDGLESPRDLQLSERGVRRRAARAAAGVQPP